MDTLDRVRERARELLVVQTPSGREDLWLWEHSERVMLLTHALANLPDRTAVSINRTAAALAGLFSNAGWATHVRSGEVNHWQMLGRPTSDVQRELAASMLKEHISPLVPADVLFVAMDAIRQCNDREADMPETHVLSEAESLAEMGVAHMLRQFRQYEWEGRPLTDLLEKWQRQKEYRYWEARISDSLRTDTAKQMARQRLATIDQFMQSLATECAGDALDGGD